MVVVMLIGGSYAALRPWLNRSPDFDAVLLGVSADRCNTIRQQRITPTETLCVCMRLFAEAETVQYQIRLRTASGKLVVRTETEAVTDEVICQQLRLDDRLDSGRYVVEIRPPDGNAIIASYWFDVGDPLPVASSSIPWALAKKSLSSPAT